MARAPTRVSRAPRGGSGGGVLSAAISEALVGFAGLDDVAEMGQRSSVAVVVLASPNTWGQSARVDPVHLCGLHG